MSPGATFSAEPPKPAGTDEGEDEAAELAKQLSNPVAALISVPFQANEDFAIGPASGERFTLNIQPVIPISISKDWNLILRTILPVISQTDVFGKSGTQSGLGNTTQSFFLSPKAPGPGGIIWGLGPVGYYPTATDSLLGPEKWGLGPTLVALVQEKGWTVGILANQIWSVGGDPNEQNISSMFLQPFLTYTTKTHTTFGVNTESTYNWENDEWTVPINFWVSQILKVGKQPPASSSVAAITPNLRVESTGAFALTSRCSFRLPNPSRRLYRNIRQIESTRATVKKTLTNDLKFGGDKRGPAIQALPGTAHRAARYLVHRDWRLRIRRRAARRTRPAWHRRVT